MADVTGASFPITLGGAEYHMSPLSDIDIEELNNWLRSRFIQMARDSLPENASQQQVDDTLRVAMQTAHDMSWMTGAGAKQMSHPDGIARLLWQSLRKRHPDLTHAQVRALIVSPATIASVMATFDHVNFSDAMRRTTPSGSPKAKGRRRTR